MKVPNPPLKVPLHARVIECVPDGRIIVTRLTDTIVVELHRGSIGVGTFEVRFVEIDKDNARALALALEELMK